MNFENFHFLRPAWLLASALVLPLLWTALRARRNPGAWSRVCEPHLLAHLIVEGAGRGTRWPLALLAGAVLATSLALAGPTWERLPQPAYREPSQTVLVLDLSDSMWDRDVTPSRIARARYEVLDLLERAEGAVALLVFAEEPYAVTPLTDDPRVIAAQVPILSPDVMPGRGARVDRALDRARELLAQAGAPRGRVVLVGDGAGDDPAAARDAARRVADAGYTVSVLGVGGDFQALAELADAGDGRFAALAADDSDVERVLGGANAAGMLEALEETDLRADVWRDMGAWLVLVPLLLAPLAFRRHWAGALVLLAFVAADARESRADVRDWFTRPDQRGAEAFAAGAHSDAAALFEDPAWRGSAQYRSGDYAGAVETLSGLEDPEAQYNLGNALARAQQLEEAITAYDRVLEAEPDHADAQHNRELVKKLLEQQQEQQQQQQQQQQQSQGGQSQQDAEPQQEPQDASQNDPSQDPQSADGEQRQDPQSADGEPSQDEGSQSARSDETQPRSEPELPQTQSGQQSQDEQPQEQKPPQPPLAGGGSPSDPSPAPPAETADDPAAAAAGSAGAASPDEDPQQHAGAPGGRELSERDQEVEQWLNRVPDDPAGLLREKLRRRYAEKRYGALRGGR